MRASRLTLLAAFVSVIAVGLLPTSPSASASSEQPLSLEAAREFLWGRPPSTAQATKARDQKSICFDRSFRDTSSDVRYLDVVQFGVGYDCDDGAWVFVLITDDLWFDDELDIVVVALDVDGSTASGCGGDEYTIIGLYDDGLRGVVAYTPECDSSTWVDRGDAFIAQAPDEDGLGLVVDESQIGTPDEAFGLSGVLANVYDEEDAFPNSGRVLVGESTTTTTRARTTTTAPRRTTTTTTAPEDPSTTDGADSAGGGYWILDAAGQVRAYGDAGSFGDVGGCAADLSCRSFTARPQADGYWVLNSNNGVVVARGTAKHHGNWIATNQPPVAIASTLTGGGYWILGANGAVQSFGDAKPYGEVATAANASFKEIVPTSTGQGYWLMSVDGGVFTFGDAAFFGSTGNLRLNAPIVGMEPTPRGDGYWLLASDGGVFTFGAAPFYGSTGAMTLVQPVVGMASTVTGRGYLLVARDGGVFVFGDGRFFGSAAGTSPGNSVVAISIV